jgi:hypothetical protein
MSLTTTSVVRLLSNLTVSDISDADITSIITQATAQINSDINIKVVREQVFAIDSTRENNIDGSNSVYYIQNWHGKFLADLDNDGDVDTSDVIVYQVSSTGTETTLTVSSIDDDDCKITLSAAPSAGVRLYITYAYSYVRQLAGSVDNRLSLAAAFLTIAYCYAKINFGRAKDIQFGSTKLTRHMESFKLYYDRYLEIAKQIQSIGGLVQTGENIWTY